MSEKAPAGVYEITAFSRTKGGTESTKSLPIKVIVNSPSVSVFTVIINTFSLLIPLLALFLLLVGMAIWGWYKVLHYKEKMHAKLMHTKSFVTKSFDILDEDVEEEVKIFKKIKSLQSLTSEERSFINQFKKDIEEAEKTILNEMKE